MSTKVSGSAFLVVDQATGDLCAPVGDLLVAHSAVTLTGMFHSAKSSLTGCRSAAASPSFPGSAT